MNDYTQKDLLILWLDSFIGLEYHKKVSFLEKLQNSKSIKSTVIENKEFLISSFGEKVYNTILASSNNDYVNFVLTRLSDKGVRAVTIDSPNYPDELKVVDCPPLVLYAKGDISLLKNDKFCVVGSRKSLPISHKFAEDYVINLVKHNFTLVTGIAVGIDDTVIKTTLKEKGKCISVIAGGFDNVTNKKLLDELVKTGLAISEYPPEVAPLPFFFPVRNRIMAGLSKAVLIVNGGMKSGTIYTAEFALEYGKDVFVIPYTPNVESGAGNNYLIKSGGILTDSFKDIADYLKIDIKEEVEIQLSEEEKRIIDLLKDGGVHTDIICQKLNKQIYEITPILSALEIKGVIVKSGFNTYAKI